MINLSFLNKVQPENNKNLKKFVSHIVDYNKKEPFQVLSDNSSVDFPQKILSQFKIKFRKKKLEFFTLKQDIPTNKKNDRSSQPINIQENPKVFPEPVCSEISSPKNVFSVENDNKKNKIKINGHKRIRQKQDEEKADKDILILNKKECKEKDKCNDLVKFKEKEINNNKYENQINSIDVLINDKFYDLLVNIYEDEGIEIGFKNENDKISGEDNFNKHNLNINKNNFKNNQILEQNELNNEQISCICLRSKCLNNYCSCHKNGNFCNGNCRCVGCKNNDNSSNSLVEINKNKCKCQNSNCNSLYCDCRKRGELCNKKCLCTNCKNQASLKSHNK